MIWIEKWRAISARIEGLKDASNYAAHVFKINSQDSWGTTKRLVGELKLIMDELQEVYRHHSKEIPVLAASALDEQLKRQPKENLTSAGNDPIELQVLAQLFMFQSRFEYLIRDADVDAKSLTELTFEHLRRLISVDDQVRNAWKEAFEKREEQCERRGAVHLLSHGIWAFKVQGGDSATDLVFNEPLTNHNSIVNRTGRAIVLTEWKMVRDIKDLDSNAATARNQTKRYAGGVLGGLELKSTRYIVLVGKNWQVPPKDIIEDGITYRHIWIAVDPETPSVSSRKSSG